MKFSSDVAQRYLVGNSNQTSKLHFHSYFKQRPIQPQKISNSGFQYVLCDKVTDHSGPEIYVISLQQTEQQLALVLIN